MKSKSQLKILYFLIFFSCPAISAAHYVGTIDKSFIEQFLPQNPIIVEAGAHKGNDTLEMINLWPDAQIHAFEPVPYLYRKLCHRTRSYAQIHCYPLALSKNNKGALLYKSSMAATGASTILKPTKLFHKIFPLIAFQRPIWVCSINLDDWAQQQSIDHIDFLWLDLQGVEPTVLMDAPEILKTVNAIYTEVNFYPLYEDSIVYEQYKEFLQKQGFN